MNQKHKYTGILTAIPTPLNADLTLNVESLTLHIQHLLGTPTDAIIPLGGTGEYTSLSFAERMQVVECAVAAGGGKLPIIPGILSPGIGDAVDNAKAFMSAGADALMVVTPYYFRPTQQGILDYYKRFSDEVDSDIILYEIPYRTGVSLHHDTVAKLAEQTRVVGIKACNPDLAVQMRVAESSSKKISILSGEEDVLPLHVAMGAVGAIISSSNLIPKHWAKVLNLALQGHLQESIDLHTTLRPLIDLIFSEPNPAPIKAALTQQGFPMGDVLAPLKSASQGLQASIAELVPAYIERERLLAL